MPWIRLAFRGPRYLVASLRAGLPWLAAAWPLNVAFVALLGGRPGGDSRADPTTLLVGLAHYALVSVTSQEFLYSSFFFWRYRPLF